MYQILDQEHDAAESPVGDAASLSARPGLTLHMRENRSILSNEARGGFAALALMLVVVAILPVLSGHILVPIVAISALAALTFALEHHARRVPASETLAVGGDGVLYHDSTGRILRFLPRRLRFVAERRADATLHLILHGSAGRLEIGRCLNQAERRAVAALIVSAIAACYADGGATASTFERLAWG